MTASGLGNSAFPQSATFSLSSSWSQLCLGLRPPRPRMASASVPPRLQLHLALSQLSEALEALPVFSRALRWASSLVFSQLGSRRPDLNKLQAPELPVPASSRVRAPGLLPRLQLLLGPSRRKLPSSPSFAQAPELPVPASSRVQALGLLPRLQLLLGPSRRKLPSSLSFAQAPLLELPSAFPYSLGPQPLLATRRWPLLLGFVRSRTPASPRHSALAAPSASALYGLGCFLRTCSASASTPIWPRLFPSDLLGLSAQHQAPLGFSPWPQPQCPAPSSPRPQRPAPSSPRLFPSALDLQSLELPLGRATFSLYSTVHRQEAPSTGSLRLGTSLSASALVLGLGSQH